nr:type II toxin-antitoxin system HicA family toxin [Colwellia psychrerythraea]
MVRQGKGSHQIWESPINTKMFVVPHPKISDGALTKIVKSYTFFWEKNRIYAVLYKLLVNLPLRLWTYSTYSALLVTKSMIVIGIYNIWMYNRITTSQF